MMVSRFSPSRSSGAGMYSRFCGPISQKRPRVKPFNSTVPLPQPGSSRKVSAFSSTSKAS